MPVQVYMFQITYQGCEERIWRKAAVSSNSTLADLGYLVLSSFNTAGCKLFEMKYRDTVYVLTEEDLLISEPFKGKKPPILSSYHLSELTLQPGDNIEMTYDFGCEHRFTLELVDISPMLRGHGRAYPKILDGAGRGIIEDIPASELLEIMKKIDQGQSSGLVYPEDCNSEWDWRRYDITGDNILLKVYMEEMREAYEYYE